ncbi:MAG: hypothetical protein ACRERC_20885 [Candidatus Binatia bacterium]
MDRTIIFAALQWECRTVLRHLRQVRRTPCGPFPSWRASTPRGEVWVVKTGIGIERATAAATAAGEARDFARVISTGCAGGLSPALHAGDLAVATAVIDGGRRQMTDAAGRTQATAIAAAAGLRSLEGPILCSPVALTGVDDKRRAAAGGAIVVEMEGAPIAEWAARGATPFLAVRAVLDGAGDALHLAGNFIDPSDGSVRPLALAGYIATHPSVVSELLAMQRMQRAARDSLERFFAGWLAGSRARTRIARTA